MSAFEALPSVLSSSSSFGNPLYEPLGDSASSDRAAACSIGSAANMTDSSPLLSPASSRDNPLFEDDPKPLPGFGSLLLEADYDDVSRSIMGPPSSMPLMELASLPLCSLAADVPQTEMLDPEVEAIPESASCCSQDDPSWRCPEPHPACPAAFASTEQPSILEGEQQQQEEEEVDIAPYAAEACRLMQPPAPTAAPCTSAAATKAPPPPPKPLLELQSLQLFSLLEVDTSMIFDEEESIMQELPASAATSHDNKATAGTSTSVSGSGALHDGATADFTITMAALRLRFARCMAMAGARQKREEPAATAAAATASTTAVAAEPATPVAAAAGPCGSGAASPSDCGSATSSAAASRCSSRSASVARRHGCREEEEGCGAADWAGRSGSVPPHEAPCCGPMPVPVPRLCGVALGPLFEAAAL
ncbi:hypothetical protein GPECTOR_54g227 [Gonium pectorale]|uniref:Uncharacterized protein n=1 Tax=Gonium pectorale TaxID=33097 RepID=A0A150G6J0_GONPE|nr:hypothetical protein GPECTOR_54g227 [Gonium pectorale]|eukprot:KXZ45486.1 hypothetical protein GPECTOR_54g227 [Gonium pectorale]